MIVTREVLLDQLYGGVDEPGIKIIEVFINRLRRKLADASNGKQYIQTIWGNGYVLREPHEREIRMSA
jgi:two-component system cell cycle response regulator CtrA